MSEFTEQDANRELVKRVVRQTPQFAEAQNNLKTDDLDLEAHAQSENVLFFNTIK